MLGERTARMHFALAGEETDASFSPEPFTSLYQRSIYQSMRGVAAPDAWRFSSTAVPHLDGDLRKLVLEVLGGEPDILARVSKPPASARSPARKSAPTAISTSARSSIPGRTSS